MIAGKFEIEFAEVAGENCYVLVVDGNTRHTYPTWMFSSVWAAITDFANIYYQGGTARWRVAS